MRARGWIALATLCVACGGGAEAPSEEAEPALDEVEVVEASDEAEEEAETEEAIEAPAPIVPSTHELLMLVAHEGPLLPSEERQMGVIEARLRRGGADIERREATEEEVALLRALEGEPLGAMPATLGSAQRVLVLRVAAPRTRSDGEFVSRGLSGVMLLRPPSAEPFFTLALEPDAGWRRSEGEWTEWLEGLLREGEGA